MLTCAALLCPAFLACAFGRRAFSRCRASRRTKSGAPCRPPAPRGLPSLAGVAAAAAAGETNQRGSASSPCPPRKRSCCRRRKTRGESSAPTRKGAAASVPSAPMLLLCGTRARAAPRSSAARASPSPTQTYHPTPHPCHHRPLRWHGCCVPSPRLICTVGAAASGARVLASQETKPGRHDG